MKPWLHAKSSARKWGGLPEDYLPLHDFLDSSKACVADMRHRAILHSAFGIYVLERLFGTNIVNSEGKTVSVRDVGEQHVIEDLGFIPSMDRWLKNLPKEEWMFGSRKREPKTGDKFIPLKEEVNDNVD